MDIWRLLAIFVTLFALAYSIQGLSFTLDKENWISKNWEEEPLEERLASQMASRIKRSKSQQFYGLMGKRSEMSQPLRVDRRRNKGETFVGLMGRRSLRGDTFTRMLPSDTSTALEAEADKQSVADLQAEWDQLQYY